MNPSDGTNTQQPAWRQQIGDLQDQACRAFLAPDIDALSRVLSDDFVVNSPVGRVLTKGETLDLLQRGIIRHFSYNEQIEVMMRHGDLVVVMGWEVVTNSPDGLPIRRRFTNMWCEMAGSWQLIARHAHHIAES